MDLKLIIFCLVAFLGAPLGALACRAYPPLTRAFVILLVWSTCEPYKTGMNFLSREFYRSASRGVEVTMSDICAIILFLYLLMRNGARNLCWRPPLTVVFWIYFGVGLISWTQVGPSIPVPPEATLVPYPRFEVGLYPLFELVKLLRGFFLYFVLVNYLQEKGAYKSLAWALALAVLYMGVSALMSRYIDGVNRVKVTLGHANSLATYMAMMGTMIFSMALYTRKWAITAGAGFLTMLALLGVILTISRGGLVGLAVGLLIVTAALLPRYTNVKNLLLLMAGVVAVCVVIAIAADTLAARFFGKQDAAADLEYRGLYNSEAKLMAKERTFGVGLANFSAWSWTRYGAMVDPDLPPGTPAHNVWFLNLGELGYPGLCAFILFWGRWLFLLGLPGLAGGPKDMPHALRVGATASIFVCHVQSALQLGYRQTPLFLMLMIFLAIVSAVHLGDRRAKQLAAPAAAAA